MMGHNQHKKHGSKMKQGQEDNMVTSSTGTDATSSKGNPPTRHLLGQGAYVPING